jgi:hypothetical protein
MGESKRSPNQKRHKKAAPTVTLTPEQQAELKAAQEKAAEERKAEQERFQNWEKSVEKMSRPQVKAEINRYIKSQRIKTGKDTYENIPGLPLAFAVVLKHVYANTKSQENPFAKLFSYPR